MKKIVGLVLVIFLLGGCTTMKLQPGESWENLLNKVPRPITVISISSSSSDIPFVLFQDAKGRFFTIRGPQFSALEVGHTFY